MATYTSNAGAVLRPEDVDALVVQPVIAGSVAAQVSTTRRTGSPTLRIPIVTDDPRASWVEEGQEIVESDPGLDELNVVPGKIAGLTVVSNELANDSDPAAAEVVGEGLSRDISRRLDEAYFSAMPLPAPPGLEALTGVSTVDAGAAWSGLDPFTEAQFVAADQGAQITAFVTNSTDGLALAQLKETDGSNRYLLGVDPNQPTRRLINGVPMFAGPYVAANTVWAIAQPQARLAIRSDVEVAVDSSAYFSSDRVGIRAKMRVGFGWPSPAAVVKVTVTPV